MNIEAFNVRRLTPTLLKDRLSLAVKSLELKMSPETIKKGVDEYFSNEDHGYAHGLTVYKKGLEILRLSPNIARNAAAIFSSSEVDNLLFIGAMLHDIGRFLMCDHQQHERLGAELVQAIFDLPHYRSPHSQELYDMIVRHDYFSPVTGEGDMPAELSKPLPEVLRLADKTSVSPELEVERWWACGQRYKTPFFNPELKDEVRFDLKHNNAERDQVTHFLLLFALQPSDFYSYEAATYYGLWAQGKGLAVASIMRLARECDCDESEVTGVLRRFHEHYGIALPQGL